MSLQSQSHEISNFLILVDCCEYVRKRDSNIIYESECSDYEQESEYEQEHTPDSDAYVLDSSVQESDDETTKVVNGYMPSCR